MTYNVMTDGYVHSSHETKADAEAEIAQVWKDAEQRDDEEAAAYAETLTIEKAA